MINIFLATVVNFEETPEILLFGVILGAFLMVISRIWKQKIYSVLAVGVWLFMMFQLSDYVALLITFIGLMTVELYHAFISRAGER